MTHMIRRNLLCFFRDKASVFFSLLAVFIIVGLYVLFLGDAMAGEYKDLDGARFFSDSWIMSGILAVTSLTTTMGAAGVMVSDRAKGQLKDFESSPLRRGDLALAYGLSTFFVGVVMSAVTLAIAEGYIALSGGELLALGGFFKVFGLIILSCLAGGSLVLFLVSFFSSENAFAAASSVIGTLVGFLTGIYMPIGILPAPVRLAIKLFPVSHSAVLFRKVFTAAPLARMFAGAPEELRSGHEAVFGVTFYIGGFEFPAWLSVAILGATAAVFTALAMLRLGRKKKK